MHEYVYSQGYTIREKVANRFGEHNMLRVKKDGTTDFIKYYSKGAGTPWARFLNKRDAEYYMFKKALPDRNYEVVKATHPKYLKLVDENYGLYKVVASDDYDLIIFGKDKVKYMDNTGTQQDYPIIPPSIKKSSGKLLYYLFKDIIDNWRYLDGYAEDNPIDLNDTCSLRSHIYADPDNHILRIVFQNKFNIKGYTNLDDSLDRDIRMLFKKFTDVFNPDIVDSGFNWITSNYPHGVGWMTVIKCPLKDFITSGFIPSSKLPKGTALTKMSDKEIYDLKEYIEEHHSELLEKVIVPKITKCYHILVDCATKVADYLQEYFKQEVFESLDNLSLKELFTEVYKD